MIVKSYVLPSLPVKTPVTVTVSPSTATVQEPPVNSMGVFDAKRYK